MRRLITVQIDSRKYPNWTLFFFFAGLDPKSSSFLFIVDGVDYSIDVVAIVASAVLPFVSA